MNLRELLATYGWSEERLLTTELGGGGLRGFSINAYINSESVGDIGTISLEIVRHLDDKDIR